MPVSAQARLESVGRYRILGELGCGSMGTVYRARDTIIEREVALKVVPRPGERSSSLQQQTHARFMREVRAAGSLLHPNIVAVFDVGDDELREVSYLAMEIVEGEPLDRLIDRQVHLPCERIRSIAVQVLSALEAAHARGIVHRDIKPANLILSHTGMVKVADFGIARITGAQMTHSGAFLGSPAYMSPEQVETSRVDHRSDLFSLGAVLFELVTLRRAFPGDSVVEVINKVLREDPVPPEGGFREDLPEDLAHVMSRALSKRVEDRFSSAEAMRQVLESETGAVNGDGARATRTAQRPAEAADGGAVATLVSPARAGRVSPRRSIVMLGIAAGLAGLGSLAMLFSDWEGSGDEPVQARIEGAEPLVTARADLTSRRWVTPPAGGGLSIEKRAASDEPSERSLSLEDWLQPPVSYSSGLSETVEQDLPICSVAALWPEETASPTGALDAATGPLYVLDVKHTHRLGSCQGTLRLFEGRLEYDSEDRDVDDRFWEYSDLAGLTFNSDGELGFTATEHDDSVEAFKSRRYNFRVKGSRRPFLALEHLARHTDSGDGSGYDG